jgi:hypothetical protein
MGPFQVTCVLAAAVLAAGFSTTTTFAQQQPQGRGCLPLPDKLNLGSIGERTDAVICRPSSDLRRPRGRRS